MKTQKSKFSPIMNHDANNLIFYFCCISDNN